MSWEPGIPTGYSPCGIAFGALSSCYSAPCRFFADDAKRDNRIFWYFVPDSTPVYDQWTQFTPRLDDADVHTDPFCEVSGRGAWKRQRESGEDVYYRPKSHVDGDLADFLGNSPRSKYYKPFPPSEIPSIGSFPVDGLFPPSQGIDRFLVGFRIGFKGCEPPVSPCGPGTPGGAGIYCDECYHALPVEAPSSFRLDYDTSNIDGLLRVVANRTWELDLMADGVHPEWTGEFSFEVPIAEFYSNEPFDPHGLPEDAIFTVNVQFRFNACPDWAYDVDFHAVFDEFYDERFSCSGGGFFEEFPDETFYGCAPFWAYVPFGTMEFIGRTISGPLPALIENGVGVFLIGNDAWRRANTFNVSVKIGISVLEKFDVAFSVGVVHSTDGSFPDTLAVGVLLGVEHDDAPPDPDTLEMGIQLGIAVDDSLGVASNVPIGVQLGLALAPGSDGFEEEPETYSMAFKTGIAIEDNGAVSSNVSAAFVFGVSFVDGEGDAPTVNLGVQLGLVLIDNGAVITCQNVGFETGIEHEDVAYNNAYLYYLPDGPSGWWQLHAGTFDSLTGSEIAFGPYSNLDAVYYARELYQGTMYNPSQVFDAAMYDALYTQFNAVTYGPWDLLDLIISPWYYGPDA